MSLLIHFLQSLDGRMGVNLCRRDRGVTEKLLHGAQVLRLVVRRGGEGGPHVVAGHVTAQAGALSELAELAALAFLTLAWK